MNFSTAVILLIIALIGVFSVRSYKKKLDSGCCGGTDSVKKVRAADGNKANYPHHRVAVIDGMVCLNCARRVENAFNSQSGCMAKVNVEKKTADIYGKAPLEDGFIRSTVAKAGYSVLKISDN